MAVKASCNGAATVDINHMPFDNALSSRGLRVSHEGSKTAVVG